MKLVRKHIDEKFTEVSDPIKDMGIGIEEQLRAFMKSDEIQEYLLDEDDADTNNKDILLLYSVVYEKQNFIDYLLHKGANINNTWIEDEFLRSCQNGWVDIVKILLKNGFDFHGNASIGWEKGLRVAIANDQFDIVKLLVEAGANVNVVEGKPIRVALANKHTKILQYLIEKGADIGKKDYINAATDGGPEMVDLVYSKIKEKRRKKIRKFLHLKEDVNEKFTEVSDPIKDMRIGLEKYKQPQNDIDNFFNLVDEYMIKFKNVKDWNKLKSRYLGYIKISGNQMRLPFMVGNQIFKDLKTRKLLEVNEKFTEEGDPLADMNIGQNFYKEKIAKLFPLRYGNYGVDYVALVKYTLFEPETTVEESKDYMGRTMYTIKCNPKEAEPFYNYLASLVTHQKSNVHSTKQIGKRGRTEALVIIMDDVQKPAPLDEKFTEESDPLKDMGIGAKFVYYRLYKSDAKFYTMYISGDTYHIKEILKRYNFKWSDHDYAWKSRFSIPKELWEKTAPAMFQEIEKVGGHVVQPKGKLSKFDIDMERSFFIPGYDKWEYPFIPDGNGAKVYIKQWHHHAPVVGAAGKGTYYARALLRYEGFNFNHGSHMWEKVYNREEIDDMLKYLKDRGYNVIDARKVQESLNEKFTQEADPIATMGIGGFKFGDELRMLLNKFNPEKKVIPFGKLLKSKAVQYYWKKRLEDWFVGNSATGIFAKGNEDSYGAFQKYTTGKIVRVEIFPDWGADEYDIDFLNFALIEHKKGAWFNDIKDAERWVNADEIWWYYLPKEIHNAKLPMDEKIFVSVVNEKFTEKSDPIKDMGIGDIDIMGEIQKMYTDKENKYGTVFKKTFKKIEEFLSEFLDREIEGNFKKGFFEEFGHYRFIPVKFTTFFGASRVQFIDKFKTTYELIPGERYKTSTLSEKFIEDGDPIHQMGIGIEHVREFETFQEAAKIFVDNISILSKGVFKSKEDLRQYLKDSDQGVATSGRSLLRTCKDYCEGFGKEFPGLIIKEFGDDPFTSHPTKLQYLKYFRDEVAAYAKQRLIREEFKEESDPIKDIGIGMEPLMKKYKDDKLVKHYQIFKNFKKELFEGYGLPLEKLFYLGENIFPSKNKKSYKKLTISQIIENSQLIYHKEIFNSEKTGRRYLDDSEKETVELFVYNTKFGKIADVSWRWTTRTWGWNEGKNIYFGDVFVLNELKRQLNEEFKEKSDPIVDMRIGRYEKYRLQCIDILRRFLRHYSNSECFQLKKKLLHGKEITFDDLKTIKEWGNFLVKLKKMPHTLNLPNINEKFKAESDPIRDMGIGHPHLIFDIEFSGEGEDGEFTYYLNQDLLIPMIKKYIKGISDNEVDRFWAFQLKDIIDDIPMQYFENKDYKTIDKYIEMAIAAWGPSWMGMHSDNAMRSMMR